MTTAKKINNQLPDTMGFYGNFGGRFVPEFLEPLMQDIEDAYHNAMKDEQFLTELTYLNKHYTGRPSPIFYAQNLSKETGGAKIYLKREDLNHTGAHKINHCLGESLLAKRMGKKKIIAETGAGQHGVALATAAALVGLECDIYMGEVDMKKEYPNVLRMKILGANVIPVYSGLKTLKEAVDEAFVAYLKDPVTQLYAIGSVVGPHPFPAMVSTFQSVIGIEAKEQFKELTGDLPNALVACVGGGSNAMGLFSAFFSQPRVAMYGIEPHGKGKEIGQHAATLTYGKPGMIHGFKTILLQDEKGEPAPVYSIASGLDYPGVGPQHAYLQSTERVTYKTITDSEAISAFFKLSRTEGIIPAIESAHAVAYAIKLAKTMSPEETILINLSGRGDKDIDFVAEKFGEAYGI